MIKALGLIRPLPIFDAPLMHQVLATILFLWQVTTAYPQGVAPYPSAPYGFNVGVGLSWNRPTPLIGTQYRNTFRSENCNGCHCINGNCGPTIPRTLIYGQYPTQTGNTWSSYRRDHFTQTLEPPLLPQYQNYPPGGFIQLQR